MKNRRTFEEHWEEISDSFDFVKVKKVMDFLDWEWGHKEGLRVPSMERIIKEAKRLCRGAYESEYDVHGIGSGGFYAEYCKEHDMLELQFQLCGWVSENY